MSERFNGKTGEYVRLFLALGLAALVSYFTAIGSINSEQRALKATQDSQFGEVMRSIEVLRADIRELRSEIRNRP